MHAARHHRRDFLDAELFQAGGISEIKQLVAIIIDVLDAEMQQLSAEGPTDGEMERILAQAEAHFIYRLQTVGGFGGKSDQLNAYNVLRGDPAFFAADLQRYRAATAESIRQASETFLAIDRRVVLSIVPRGSVALALPGSIPVSVS